MTDLNFSDLYDEANTILTGDFDVVIKSAVAGQSANGKPQIKIQATVEGGPNHGHTFFDTVTVSRESSTAMKMFFITMAGYGLDRDYFVKNPSMEQIASDLDGKRARYTVESNMWQGVERERVKTVKRSSVGGPGAGLPSSGSALPTAAPAPTTASAKTVTPVEPTEDPWMNTEPAAGKTTPPDLPF